MNNPGFMNPCSASMWHLAQYLSRQFTMAHIQFLMKGIMPGAVLAFLIAGPATNTVTLSFVYKKLGKKVAVIYLISIVITSIFLGIIFDLITGGVNVSSNVAHTHGENGVGIITLIMGIV